MIKWTLIAVGGAAGSVLRYGMQGVVQNAMLRLIPATVFPWGTLAVNLLGSLLIGFLYELSQTLALSPNIRLFIFIGILGGFTTFSSFSQETFNLLRDTEYKLAAANMLASNLLGVALTFAGFFAARWLVALLR